MDYTVREQPLSISATPGQRILMGYEFFWIETRFCANLTICVKLTPNVFVSSEKFVLIWLIIILTTTIINHNIINQNHLLIGPDKTKLLVMGTRQMLQKLPDFYITLLGKEIAPVASARDLGVQVDATLSYNERITNISSTCMASLCQIIKHLLDLRTLESVIKSLVFSKLYFCSTVWTNTSKTNVRKLPKVQNFAARIFTGTRKYDHITPVLNDL